eukprot:CAMPEP_0119562732 /NCGR_PEP_ID=MMETSP1352-20130426/21343_1 /TAXON_ID=265584 /ORGANISM="Stauroneis constricta, Strain CCMP1120" /LENGTH=147 /DNA_ID=CAMNT_0007611189 /DNA_START=155 /DNA_END=595 /DNA_ORIENTATION=-
MQSTFHDWACRCIDADSAFGIKLNAADGADCGAHVIILAWETLNCFEAETVSGSGAQHLRRLETEVATVQPDLDAFTLALIGNDTDAHVVVHVLDGQAASMRDAKAFFMFTQQQLDVGEVACCVAAQATFEDFSVCHGDDVGFELSW